MLTVAGRPSTVSSLMPVGFPQNSLVGQQRQQISELQFDKFPDPQAFWMWKKRTTCSDFPSDAMLWIMVDSLEELKSSRSVSGKNFPNFEMLDARNCFCSEQDHPEFSIQDEGGSRGTDRPERRRVSTRRQIAFMIYDDFRLIGAHDTVLDYADLFSVILRDDNVLNSVQDGMKFYYLRQRFYPMMFWEVSTNWEYVSPINSKPY